MLNFAHHYEFEESGLKIEDIKNFIKERRIVYDYKADQKKYKWSGNGVLKKISNESLPKHVLANLSDYTEWLD